MGQDDVTQTAADIEKTTQQLVAQLAALPPTTDASRVIELLAVMERELATVYERLAGSHERAALEDLSAGAPESADAGPARWVEADVALRSAASLARSVADTLDQARRDEAIALWYDDIATDRRRG